MKVVFLVGATASGKSSLALDLAERFGGAILNSDSVQVYQDLLIGSAAPTVEEKRRVPHFLFQEVPPPNRITAGDYARMAMNHLENLKRKFPLVLIVGGTGFYLMALENGMLPVEKADPEIQSELEASLEEEGGARKLHEELCAKDPIAGKRISVADHYRLVRALEVIRRTGRPLSEIEKEHRETRPPFPYPLLKLGVRVAREKQRERIVLRTRKMLEEGLLEEVRGLMGRGLADWEPLQSVGYKEALRFLRGDSDIPDLKALEEKIVQSTLKLAKKQKTWFQRDAEIHWGEFDDPEFFRARVAEFMRESPT